MVKARLVLNRPCTVCTGKKVGKKRHRAVTLLTNFGVFHSPSGPLWVRVSVGCPPWVRVSKRLGTPGEVHDALSQA
eukprot:3704956-Rhodomonas_salina.1